MLMRLIYTGALTWIQSPCLSEGEIKRFGSAEASCSMLPLY
jgi:hypothetical protein